MNNFYYTRVTPVTVVSQSRRLPPGDDLLWLQQDFRDDLNVWNVFQLANPTSHTLHIEAGTHDARGPDATGAKGSLSRYGPGTQTIIGVDRDTTFIDFLARPFSKSPYFGATGINENGLLPKIDTILTGETVATLKVLADVSKFSVGNYVQLLAYDMQAFGYPVNNHFFEYRRITAVDAGTGEITLDQGVRHDYKDTFPQINDGSGVTPDQCGPATLMPMNGPQVWGYHARARDLSINPTDPSPIYSEQLEITWENCHFLGYGHIPSISGTVTYIDCEFDAFSGFEFDKSVELIVFENCICNDVITQQSSSIYECTMTGCTVHILNGTAKYTTLTDCTFDGLGLGNTAYGGVYDCVITNCTAASIQAFHKPFMIGDFISHAGGVITILYDDAKTTANNVFIRMIPDPELRYIFTHPSHGRYGPTFQCTDATFDGTTLTYTTTLDGTEPQWGVCTGMNLLALTSLTVTGSEDNPPTDKLGFLSYPAAAGLAVGEYYNSGPWPDTAVFYLVGPGEPRISGLRDTTATWMHGEIVSMTFNVTKPYTGTQATLLIAIWGEFFNGFRTCQSDLTTFGFWAPYFNLKEAGTRVITPSGVTGTASGDSGLALGSSVWFCQNGIFDGEGPRLQFDITGEDPSVYPEFELVLVLDQGI